MCGDRPLEVGPGQLRYFGWLRGALVDARARAQALREAAARRLEGEIAGRVAELEDGARETDAVYRRALELQGRSSALAAEAAGLQREAEAHVRALEQRAYRDFRQRGAALERSLEARLSAQSQAHADLAARAGRAEDRRELLAALTRERADLAAAVQEEEGRRGLRAARLRDIGPRAAELTALAGRIPGRRDAARARMQAARPDVLELARLGGERDRRRWEALEEHRVCLAALGACAGRREALLRLRQHYSR